MIQKMSYYRSRYQEEPKMTEEERSRILEAMTLTNPARDRPELGINTRDRNEQTDYDETINDYMRSRYSRR